MYFKEADFLEQYKSITSLKKYNQDVLADLFGLEVAGVSKLETRTSSFEG